MLVRHLAAILLVPTLLAAQPAPPPSPPSAPSVDDAREAMRRAVAFYANQVAIEGGYHFYYAEDLSYGRSEASEGPTQIEYQREGTPLVTLAYLDAYDATGERLFLDAARKAGGAYLRGQLCSGGWDYFVEFEPAKRREISTGSTERAGATGAG